MVGRTKFVGYGGKCAHLACPLASVMHVTKDAGTKVAVAADCEVGSYVVG